MTITTEALEQATKLYTEYKQWQRFLIARQNLTQLRDDEKHFWFDSVTLEIGNQHLCGYDNNGQYKNYYYKFIVDSSVLIPLVKLRMEQIEQDLTKIGVMVDKQ